MQMQSLKFTTEFTTNDYKVIRLYVIICKKSVNAINSRAVKH